VTRGDFYTPTTATSAGMGTAGVSLLQSTHAPIRTASKGGRQSSGFPPMVALGVYFFGEWRLIWGLSRCLESSWAEM
jgi:hypothetical protein